MTQQTTNLSRTIIQSARAYGESLNFAAYKAAREEMDEDKAKDRKGRTLSEYKDRILTQFESTIGSAKSSPALLSQLGTIAGRLTHREISPEAGDFMEAVLTGDVPMDDAKNLITAFMRLSTFKSKTAETLGEPMADDDTTEASETDPTTDN